MRHSVSMMRSGATKRQNRDFALPQRRKGNSVEDDSLLGAVANCDPSRGGRLIRRRAAGLHLEDRLSWACVLVGFAQLLSKNPKLFKPDLYVGKKEEKDRTPLLERTVLLQ